ncbi:hypothetical protein J7L02_01600 [Candidatus Woesearchaeota archaeon]|nr:hypothetical protein [Candidatus Woesearchaeota archaeon]
MTLKQKLMHLELQAHPFFENYSLGDVLRAMDYTGIDILALHSLDNSLYKYLTEQVLNIYPSSIIEKSGIKLPNNKYLLNAGEYNTREDWHVLTIGYSFENYSKMEVRKLIDLALSNNALVILDHALVDNAVTRTAGHIPEHKKMLLEDLCKEYSGEIALEWNAYCLPWIRLGLKFLLNMAGFKTLYHDVNKELKLFSEKLAMQGFNVPVLADTDLHARKKQHLKYLGTARVLTVLNFKNPDELLKDLKANIFAKRYENIERYVPFTHLLEAYCIPVLLPNNFSRPRG